MAAMALIAGTFTAPVASVGAAGTGGTATPGVPSVQAASCVPNPRLGCPPRRLVRGGKAVLRGFNLAPVTGVIFRGHDTRRDDARARVQRRSARRLVVKIPTRAHGGRLTLVDRYGSRVTTRRRFALSETTSMPITPRTGRPIFYFDGRQRPSFTFDARAAGEGQVELVDAETGDTVRTWVLRVSPGAQQTITWDGNAAGKPAPPGEYRFRMADGSRAFLSAASEAEEPFVLADHVFPIRGKHDLGQTPTNGFGGGRNHKGQDMFARCGTGIVAARGGTVAYAGYHSAAGNYVVIDGSGSGVDYVYMHMLRAPLVRTGQRVRTGESLGQVGETGRATGCHLHFEMWSAPGWYAGGSPFDPLPSLRKWDAYS